MLRINTFGEEHIKAGEHIQILGVNKNAEFDDKKQAQNIIRFTNFGGTNIQFLSPLPHIFVHFIYTFSYSRHLQIISPLFQVKRMWFAVTKTVLVIFAESTQAVFMCC